MANIEYYRALLPVDKYALDSALETHSQLQDEIGRALSAADASAARAKNELKAVEARLFLDIKSNGERVSNEVANSEVQVHRERERAHEDFLRCQQQAAEWGKLYESWQQRGWSIKALGELYSSEYFHLTSITGTAPVMDDNLRHIRQEQRSLVQRRSFREKNSTDKE